MFLLSEDEQQWYCYEDDEVYWVKEKCWGTRPTAPTRPISPDLLANKRPLLVKGLSILMIVVGLILAVLIPIRLTFSISLETAASYCLSAVLALAGGYGLWNLKRWTIPLFVLSNLIGVVEHFAMNVPFTYFDAIPLLILFYLLKNHELFNEKKSTIPEGKKAEGPT
jgi:hypothetical protein